MSTGILWPGQDVEQDFSAQLADMTTKVKTISLNLQDYGDFSTLTDGADITSIVQSALGQLPNLIKGSSGWRLFNVSVFIPGGHWTITQKRVFDLSKYGSFPAVRGFNLYGAGYENTEIIFNNNVTDTDNYLIYNNDNYGYSEIKNIRFTSKNNVEKCVYIISQSSSGGSAQSISFDNLCFTGFKGAIDIEGGVDTSEMVYRNLKFEQVPSGGYGININNSQSVNHNFYATEFENISGVGIQVQAGGSMNFFGGGLIAANGGVIFKTTDTTGSGVGTNNNTFNFFGCRTEMYDTAMLYDIADNTEVNFVGCNFTVEASGAGNVRGVMGPYLSYVNFKHCNISYHFQVRYDANAYYNGACKMLFDSCTLNDYIRNLVTIQNAGGNTAGNPFVQSIHCRMHGVGSGQKPIVDETLFKDSTNLAPAIQHKTVFLRTGADYNSGLPANGTTAFTLPLNAIITKVRIVHLSSAYTATCSYTVQSNDGTPVVFATMSNVSQGTAQTTISNDLWYIIGSTAQQTINLVQTGTNVPQTGYIAIDYI